MNRNVIETIGDQVTYVEDSLESLGKCSPQLAFKADEPEIRLAVRIFSLLVAGCIDCEVETILRVVGFDNVVRIFARAATASNSAPCDMEESGGHVRRRWNYFPNMRLTGSEKGKLKWKSRVTVAFRPAAS